MPNTLVDGRRVSKMYLDGRQVQKAYFEGRLVYANEYELTLTTNIAAGWDYVWSLLPGWVQTSSTPVKIIVPAGVELVSIGPEVQGAMHFYGAWGNRKVTVINHGLIAGRGGQGGSAPDDAQRPGKPGCRAIMNESVDLTIYNYGVIAGGGGGGAAMISAYVSGGGGAPYGLAGTTTATDLPAWVGKPGSRDAGGAGGYTYGTNKAGAGGGWAQAGGESNEDREKLPGGAPGEATRGAINWAILGDVRGARA